MKYYKDTLYIAANYAYNEEVVWPDMEDITIGDDKNFSSKEEWIAARVQEWLDEAAIERAAQHSAPDQRAWQI